MLAPIWGCPTTAMCVFRLGAEKANRMLFTGDWTAAHPIGPKE